jgi:hypothetical protein
LHARLRVHCSPGTSLRPSVSGRRLVHDSDAVRSREIARIHAHRRPSRSCARRNVTVIMPTCNCYHANLSRDDDFYDTILGATLHAAHAAFGRSHSNR